MGGEGRTGEEQEQLLHQVGVSALSELSSAICNFHLVSDFRFLTSVVGQ